MMSRMAPPLFLAVLALAACKPDAKTGEEGEKPPPTPAVVRTARDCFPEAARRWIAIDDNVATAAARATGPATVYIDASGSMAGYLRGGRRGERPFEEFVTDAAGSIGLNQAPVAHVLFGRALRPLDGAQLNTLARAETYACNGQPDCDNQESRLDLVLRDIADKPIDHLSVIVTDLWLANSELTTSGSAALNTPLRRLLTDRSIAVYGLDAPYSGQVYDLPSGRTGVSAARRPLYIVAVGSAARLRALDESLRQSPSAYINQAFSGGAVRHALFTRTPETARAAVARPFTLTASPVLRPSTVIRARQGLNIQQLELARGAARQARVASGRPGARPAAPHPGWTGPDPAAIAPGAVWSGELTATTRLWKQKRDGATCRASDWEDAGLLEGGWSPGGQEGQRTFTLDPARLSDRLSPGTPYLLVGEVARVGLTRSNPATAWMREWSFSPATEADVLADPPALFPTLNLAETARLMENALADSATEPQTVGGFAVVIEVKG